MVEQPKHYRIHVYAPGMEPLRDEPEETSLCPEARENWAVLEVWPSQVTCRRCRQLLDVLWLDNPEAPAGDLPADQA